jgi:hypothetical protein
MCEENTCGWSQNEENGEAEVEVAFQLEFLKVLFLVNYFSFYM